jgi:hypothetical protein
MAGPLIVTAELGPEDFAWLNDLRRHHFPPDRNQLDAHLTMFHAVPPSAESELRQILRTAAELRAPPAWIAGTMNLGGGVALRVASDDLNAIRAEVAHRLHGLLTAQDSAGWSAHVTIQNKVPPREARALLEAIGEQFTQRPVRISGLGLHRYLGGPWEALHTYAFRG